MSKIMETKAGKLLVKVYDSRQSMGAAAAKEVAEKIRELLKDRKDINVLFAAAPSQNEFLATLVEDASIEWNRINAFHLDEYVGIDKDAPQGFVNFLKARIFDKVPFKSVNTLNANAASPEEECKRYQKLLEENPIDIACIGIGENGHIAFNDPHVAFFDDAKLVKIVDLDQKCRQQQVNDGCFAKIDDVPTNAFTLTVPAITNSKYIYCIVPAKTKAEAVFNTVKGEIRERVPASILRLHSNAVLYTDKDSASLIL